MNLLAIETATSQASIALQVEGKRWTAEEATLKKHAEWVLEAIHELLQQANTSLSALDGIVFDQGPGSFTGIRIACGIAKGLAMGANLPIYPVSSLDAIADAVRQQPAVLAVLDARMQAWYWAQFQSGQQQGDIHVSHPEAVFLVHDKPVWLAGVGFDALLDTLPQTIRSQLLGTQEVYPSAAHLLSVVEKNNIHPVTPAQARPLYVRQQVTAIGGSHG